MKFCAGSAVNQATTEQTSSSRYLIQTHRCQLPPPLQQPPLRAHLLPPPLPHRPPPFPFLQQRTMKCTQQVRLKAPVAQNHLPPAKERKRAEANIQHSASARVTERAKQVATQQVAERAQQKAGLYRAKFLCVCVCVCVFFFFFFNRELKESHEKGKRT